MTDRQFLSRLLKEFFVAKDGRALIRQSAIFNEQAVNELISKQVQAYAQQRIDSGEGFEEFT